MHFCKINVYYNQYISITLDVFPKAANNKVLPYFYFIQMQKVIFTESTFTSWQNKNENKNAKMCKNILGRVCFERGSQP